MPVSLSELFADEKSLEIAVGSSTLTVTYRTSGITPETEERFRLAVAERSNGEALVTFLAPMLLSWDLVDSEGKPLPISVETLRRLPLRFLAQVTEAIGADVGPNPPSAGTSGAGRRRKAK